MKRRFALGMMLVALIPATMLAQVPATTSGQRVLNGLGASEEQGATKLPVTLDFSLPAESEWVAKINANPTLSPAAPVSSPAEAALGATVGATELPPAGAAPASPAAAALNCECGGGGEGGGGRQGPLARWRNNSGPLRDWLRNYEPQVFHKGTISVEYGTQYWRSPIWLESAHETEMIPQVVRLGYMLNDPCPDRRLKGVFEVLAEVEAIPIIKGPGNYMVGGSALLRYHRVRNHRIVPYLQVGWGGLYTDAYQFINSPTTTGFNFITQIASGSHIFLNQKWAIMSESSYTFISNWGMNGGGSGFHVLGGLIGITRYFGANNCNCCN